MSLADCISRQQAINALGEEPPVWYDGEDEIAERNQWRRDVNAIKAVPIAQPEPAIPLQWIESKIEWLKSLDNEFSLMAVGTISALVNMWKDEQKEGD